jgi:hypothetical protein
VAVPLTFVAMVSITIDHAWKVLPLTGKLAADLQGALIYFNPHHWETCDSESTSALFNRIFKCERSRNYCPLLQNECIHSSFAGYLAGDQRASG